MRGRGTTRRETTRGWWWETTKGGLGSRNLSGLGICVDAQVTWYKSAGVDPTVPLVCLLIAPYLTIRAPARTTKSTPEQHILMQRRPLNEENPIEHFCVLNLFALGVSLLLLKWKFLNFGLETLQVVSR